jgi:hypothetical protein
MNPLDDALANRVISAAKLEGGRLLLLLDGGEALWAWPDDGGGPHARLDVGGSKSSGYSGRNERLGLAWRYVTNPRPRELLGLGAPPRPRPGHAVDQEGRRVDQAAARAAGGQGGVAVVAEGRSDGCVRLTGARDLDGVYRRVGD